MSKTDNTQAVGEGAMIRMDADSLATEQPGCVKSGL